jgi:L-lactate dehydrogenase complex protein LldG
MTAGRNERAEIFARLRQANNGRKKAPHPGQITPPKKASLKGKAMLEQFIVAAEAQFVTITELRRFQDVPRFMADWLAQQNLPKDFVLAPILGNLDWSKESHLTPRLGAAVTTDMVGMSLAYSGVAETGSVMMISGHATPTTLNFIPDVEIILLSKKDISAGMEGCWDKLRVEDMSRQMPRAVNFITGPSRSADVEATMVLGAHGPRRLHIVLVDEASPWQKNR